MKRAAAVLRDHGIEFALAGGHAIYARGGPPRASTTSTSCCARRTPSARCTCSSEAGFRCERPPEDWLYKVYDSNGRDDRPDLRAEQPARDVDAAILERADELEVYAIVLKVMSVTDVLATKLLALKEHEVDYESVLEVDARAAASRSTGRCCASYRGQPVRDRRSSRSVEELGLAPAG